MSEIGSNDITHNKIVAMDKKAQEILNGIIKEDYSDIEKVTAIYAYMMKNIEYDYESLNGAKYGEKNSEYEEAYNNLSEHTYTFLLKRQSAYNAILRGKSVCEGYTNMMHYLLKASGVNSKTVSCKDEINIEEPTSDTNHSVIKVEIEDDWYYFDPTWDAGKKIITNFFKTKEEFNQNHTLSVTEHDVESPKEKAYSEEQLQKILDKVIKDSKEKKAPSNETKDDKKEKKSPNYERKASSRDNFHTSQAWEEMAKQDINVSHESSVYTSGIILSHRKTKYAIESPANVDCAEYVASRFEDDYAVGLEGEKAELARVFAHLEVKGTFGEFENPYDGEITDAHDNPKLLLQLEKVNGLNISELESIPDIDTSELHQDIYIATYEIEEYDSKLGKNVMKPIKEYYKKSDNGEMEIIGTETEEKATFTIDGLETEVSKYDIKKGESLEKIKQLELVDKVLKDTIENTMDDGKVTEVAKITDMYFLYDLAQQCGLDENAHLQDRTYIVSTINEKGEENFDIIIRNDTTENGLETTFEHLSGIEPTKGSGRDMSVATGMSFAGGMQLFDKTKTLQEFETQSGHRYAISRDRDGKLGFNEIVRDNEKELRAETVDTYTYSTLDLKAIYDTVEINQEDINKAYKIVEKTKSEKKHPKEQRKNNSDAR